MQLFVLTATVLCCTFITAEAADVPVIHYIPSFDFDGNLVTTDATVKTEHLEGGRWIPRNLTVLEWYLVTLSGDTTYRPSTTMDVYWDFNDEAGEDTFTKQVESSVVFKSRLGPAFPLWKEHVLRGVPFNMITARCHNQENIRDGLVRMIGLVLTPAERDNLIKSFVSTTALLYGFKIEAGWWADYFRKPENAFKQYIRSCKFFAVGNPFIEHRLPCNPTSACKALLVSRLVEDSLAFNPTHITVMSFYDDEKPNIDSVKLMMKNFLAPTNPTICFRVYDTSNLSGPAVQIDLSAACTNIPPGADWQSQSFLRHTHGNFIQDY